MAFDPDLQPILDGLQAQIDGIRGDIALARADVFNVKAYGAVGDGVTDDGTAVLAAHAALKAAGGGVLFFPPGGHYIVGSDLTHDIRSSVDGQLVITARGARITYAGTENLLTVSCPTLAAFDFIDRLVVVGGKWSSATGAGCFHLRDVRGALFDGLFVDGFTERQFEFFNDYAWCELNTITNSVLAPDKHALYFNAGSDNATANGGSDSFARTRVTDTQISGGEAGFALVHATDNAGVYHSQFSNVGGNLTLGSTVDVFRLGGGMVGTVFENIGFEFGSSGSAVFDVRAAFTGASAPRFRNVNALSPVALYSDGSGPFGGLICDDSFRTPADQPAVTYSFDLIDQTRNLRNTSGVAAATWTVEPSTAVNFPIGTTLSAYVDSSGGLSIAAGPGVTIRNSPGAITARGASVTLRKIFVDTWVMNVQGA